MNNTGRGQFVGIITPLEYVIRPEEMDKERQKRIEELVSRRYRIFCGLPEVRTKVVKKREKGVHYGLH